MSTAHSPILEKYGKTKEELEAYRKKAEKYLLSMSAFKAMYKRGANITNAGGAWTITIEAVGN